MNRKNLSWLMLAAGVPFTAGAQMTTTAQLKAACEAGSHVVQITQSTKIETGPALPAAENINSACAIVIGPDASFGVAKVALNFAGALSIQSATKAAVALEEAAWRAASISINLAGESSELLAKKSRLTATAGNVGIVLGSTGKLEWGEAFAPNGNALEASGMVSLQVGSKFSGGFETAHIRGGAGVSMQLGAESGLKMNGTNVTASAGSISLTGAGTKVVLEMSQGTYRAPAGISLLLPLTESGMKVSDMTLEGGAGSILVQAGDNDIFGYQAKLEIGQSSFRTTGALRVAAGVRGDALIDNVQLDGGTGVVVTSAGNGSTIVKNSRGTSAGTISIRRGAGGVCLSDNNAFVGSAVSLCPPPVALQW